MSTEDLYNERLDRILKAVALEEPDRTPVVLEYAGFAAYVTQTSMAAFLKFPQTNIDTMIKAYELVGDGDAINYGAFWPYGLCYDFMAKVRVPGVDLPENDMWQVTETQLMDRNDYDRILREEWQSIGIPVLSGGDITTPIELLCGARSLMAFAIDLIEIPEKVEAVMDIILPHLAGAAIQQAKNKEYPLVWVGGWRGAPCLLSPAMWRRFVWPYFRKLVFEVVDSGLIALLHLDSDWTRELEIFKDLPRGKCIMALDGETDIFKAKDVLGDHMCIMGDVPASMLFLNNPDDVYAYCKRLIRHLGPRGYILQSGCDIPANAKLENVQAMVAAAVG
ncbi:MAG: uroporphyrinogen decarboxylase family protein [Desulfobacterales bacterium]|jgi:hypothetical protein